MLSLSVLHEFMESFECFSTFVAYLCPLRVFCVVISTFWCISACLEIPASFIGLVCFPYMFVQIDLIDIVFITNTTCVRIPYKISPLGRFGLRFFYVGFMHVLFKICLTYCLVAAFVVPTGPVTIFAVAEHMLFQFAWVLEDLLTHWTYKVYFRIALRTCPFEPIGLRFRKFFRLFHIVIRFTLRVF